MRPRKKPYLNIIQYIHLNSKFSKTSPKIMNFDRSTDPNQILSGVGEFYFADQTFENIFEAASAATFRVILRLMLSFN